MSPLAARSAHPRPPLPTAVLVLSADPGLIGRRHELNTLATLVEQARAGRSGVLVVRGEPGIGKSALLDEVARRAEGFAISRVAGIESEMELAYAALQQLCRPLRERVSQL